MIPAEAGQQQAGKPDRDCGIPKEGHSGSLTTVTRTQIYQDFNMPVPTRYGEGSLPWTPGGDYSSGRGS